MKQFLIVFEWAPERTAFYSLSTDDPEVIQRVEAMHQQLIGLVNCPSEVEESIMQIEEIEGIYKIFDTDDTSERPVTVIVGEKELTVVLTGVIL